MSDRRVTIPERVRPLLTRIGRLAGAQGVAAYAVGGCVRDWCLGLPTVTDLDVTVEGDGIEVARAVARALGATLTAHRQFGTATIHRPNGRGRRVDIASCRKEVYVRPAAYPKVSAGTLEDDLFRRDFAVNAMAAALSPGRFGTLIDPFEGVRDLRRKTLRILHERSFLDDPSRLLRGARFAARFHFQWDRTTLAAARRAVAAGALGWLNEGRLRRELERMLQEPNPAACLRHLEALLGS